MFFFAFIFANYAVSWNWREVRWQHNKLPFTAISQHCQPLSNWLASHLFLFCFCFYFCCDITLFRGNCQCITNKCGSHPKAFILKIYSWHFVAVILRVACHLQVTTWLPEENYKFTAHSHRSLRQRNSILLGITNVA